jgi:hypothetical protein
MIVDHYNDQWWKKINPSEEFTIPSLPNGPRPPYTPNHGGTPTVTVAEFIALKQKVEELKKEFEEMKTLLKRAKIYDEVNNQPDCESDEKLKKLKQIMSILGLDFEEIKSIIKSSN